MIYKNTKELENLRFEDTEIKKVYLGENLVWENYRIVDLGVGQTFDVSSIYDKYNELTIDNFYFTTMANASITENRPTGLYYVVDNFVKNYNSSTGILTMYGSVSGDTTARANVHAYLIINPTKLIDLGNNTTFNVSNIRGFEEFTEDNFFIKETTGGNVGGIRDPGYYTGSIRLVKNYNQETGVLTCYYYGLMVAGEKTRARSDKVSIILSKRSI